MIKFDKNEFLKPQIYSTLDECETRCNVTEEIIKEIEQLQQENKILKEKQKEFINFLEDNWEKTQDIWYIKILQKYKSIIGVSDDKTN